MVADQKRLAQKAAIPATFTLEDWDRCLEYFGGCAYCGATDDLHQDHFIPFSKDGPYTPDNIVPACSRCNHSKNDSDPEDWCTPEQYDRVMYYLTSL